MHSIKTLMKKNDRPFTATEFRFTQAKKETKEKLY